MPITLANAREQLRSKLNEANASYYTDSDLNDQLNNGCRDVARKALCLFEEQTINVYPEVGTYGAPGNVVEFKRLAYLPEGSPNVYPLDFRNYAEMDSIWGINQGITQFYPNYWTLWREPPNTQLILFPLPSSAGVLKVQYFRMATSAPADNSTLDIPEGWWDLPILYAFWNALLKAIDPRWKEVRALYNDELVTMMAAAGAGYSDNVGRMSYGMPSTPIWQWGGMDLWS